MKMLVDPKQIKVWVDAGHGGKETGAVYNGLIEKNINLVVALELERLLMLRGFQVGMTRKEDSEISLTQRCNMANDWKANYFLSVHHNAGGGDGYEAIHSIYHGIGEEIAKSIATEFEKLGQNPHGSNAVYCRKGNNGDYYAVIRQTKMPAVITEYAFLDTKDYTAIDSKEEQIIEAKALYIGFCKAINVLCCPMGFNNC
jgi:N-acetylmuramoyl-L-alanine amidase